METLKNISLNSEVIEKIKKEASNVIRDSRLKGKDKYKQNKSS